MPSMPHTILVADDEPTLLRLMEFVLVRQGHRLLAATNGEEALALAGREKPDLVVLDIMMPRLDGYAVAAAIRADPALAGLPIVMLTARTQDEDIARGVAVGVDTYLTKPFAPELLIQVVAAHLDGAPMPEAVRTG